MNKKKRKTIFTKGRTSLRAINLVKYSEINPFNSEDDFIREWKRENPEGIHDQIDKAIADYSKVLKRFSAFPDPFKIYRAIRVGDFERFFNHFKGRQPIRYFHNRYYDGIGVYWAWQKDRAIDHWSTPSQLDEELLIFTALVYKKDIDWTRTLVKNTGENRKETEIRVKEGSILHLIIIDRYKDHKTSDYPTQKGDVIRLDVKVIAKVNKINIG